MPIPVITDHFLAQVVIPFDGGVGKASTNTFYFRNDLVGGSGSQIADNIDAALTAFYTAINPPGLAALSSFYSGVIDHANVSVKVYNLGEPAPRVPDVRPMPFAAPSGSGSMFPNEVSAVLSYRSGPGTAGTGGTGNKRRRGRIYLGPLRADTGIYTSATDPDITLTVAFRNAIAGAAENLLETSQPIKWRQYSRVGNVMSDVTGGFVNNTFDTQRRRGADSTARTLWPLT